ncbi:helix-turn-helix domain-containing protein [Halorussus gelatinilyticus]|uniref:Helix-turn-helix domain-containing protein n=1 Tax=Halorussus gelatinilyticus TaxID=2937524 RepID=A0A8U0INJ8_9EURY|nr:bacterio-opsin activator domain-containing protein [Halorussus gelatinilyticus]UPW02171.1 helix-turn-helix domain-containing protein [Halorussus gelatinilyticus]
MAVESRTDYLTTAEFRRFRRRAETYREDLVVALAGRVGLRASETTRICPADLREFERGGAVHYLLTVPEGGATESGDGAAGETGSATRDAYVPPPVAHDLRKFANANDVARRDPVVDVSPRRVQMLVGEVADRTADLRDVTCRDLRQHFAWRLLAEEGVAPRVVKSVGGWASLQSLAPYLDDPTTAEVVDAFADGPEGRNRSARGRPGRSSRTHPGQSVPERRPTAGRGGATDSRSDDLLSCAGALGEALADASTAEEVERVVCDRLADRFRGVWVCDAQGEVRTSAAPEGTDGVPADALDGADLPDDGATDDARVLDALPADARPADGSLAGRSLAVAPLQSSETVHGLLCVARDSFAAADRTFLADAGRRAGRTVTAIARKQLLLADTGVELSLRTTDRGVFLVAASADLGCRFELEGVVPVEDSLLYFVTASGAAVGDVLERVSDAESVDDARLIRDYGDGALFEFAVSGASVASVLVERGGTVRELSAADGEADVTGVFSQRVDVRRVVEAVEEAFPDTDLRSKRDVEEPVRSAATVRQTVHDRITERQRTVLRAAYLAGYFEWPRGSTAEELAASMDVSSPTLHNHLRKAQQKVFDAVFDDPDPSATDEFDPT